MTNWNELAKVHHAAMVANGFHEKYSHTDLLLRGIQEVGEAASAWRKNRRADMVGFRAGVKVPNIYEIAIKHSLEEELADIALIMMDFAATNDCKISYTRDVEEDAIADTLMDISELISGIRVGIMTEGKLDVCQASYNIQWIFSNLEYLAKMFDINLEEQVRMKMDYNSTRLYRHGDKN